MGNTYSEHMTLFKRTRMVRNRDRLEAMIIIDVVLVKKDMLGYVQYMRAEEWEKAFRIIKLYCVKIAK